MISVCFRFDDASARSDHKLERGVFDIFARLDVPLCVAVIPFAGPRGEPLPISLRNAGHLFDAAKSGVIEVALHGHSHLLRGVDARGRRSEFSGVDPAVQSRLIREGTEHLASTFGQRIAGFVPPWNTYDASTTKAVADVGFDYLSAGFDALRYGPLPLVPVTSMFGTVRKAIHRASRFKSLDPVVVVLFHSNDFVEHDHFPHHDGTRPVTSFRQLEALLGWIKARPGVKLEPLGSVAKCAVNGTRLRTALELTLPYRLKAAVSPMLVRCPGWVTLPGILWGISQSKSGTDVEFDDDVVVAGANDAERV